MKTLILIVTVLFFVGCAGFVWAQQQTAPAQPAKSEQPAKGITTEKAFIMTGEVVSVDVAANAITLKHKYGKTETLKIDPKATVKKAGKIITLKEVLAGDKVGLSYKTEAGEKIATKITVKMPLKMKEPVPQKEQTAPATK